MKGVNPSVIIGTPGRMNDHLRKENFDAGTVTTLVIDEFDKCLEFGFHDEMAEVIGQLPSLKKRILLSATDTEEIPQFAGVGGDSQSSVSGSQLVKLNFLDPDALAPRLKLHKVVSPEKDKLVREWRLSPFHRIVTLTMKALLLILSIMSWPVVCILRLCRIRI